MDTPKFDIARSNSAAHDAIFTDNNGRRVYFHEDGRPYVHDSKGRRITRFKGATDWSPFVDNMKTDFRPFSNMMTYEIKGLDSNGNVIKQLVYNTELVDIMDYKARRMADNVERDIRNNAFDYVLAKKILKAHNEFTSNGVAVDGLEIDTYVDGKQVSKHTSVSGRVKPVNMMKPQQYIMPTVFNPMTINWKEWSLPDILSNESLALQHRQGDGRDYLSLRGVGLQNPNEIDTDAVKRLFGENFSAYRIYDGKDYTRLEVGPERVIDFKVGASEDEQKRLTQKALEAERQEAIQKAIDDKRKFIERDMKEKGLDPNAPIVYEAYETITAERKQEIIDRENRKNDPAYAAVLRNMKEYEDTFVDSGIHKNSTVRTEIAFDDKLLYRLYDLGDIDVFDGDKKYGTVNFHIADEAMTTEERIAQTRAKLNELSESDPKMYDLLQNTQMTDSDGNFIGYRYSSATDIIEDHRTPEQRASDLSYERARLALEQKMADKDADSYNMRRLAVTRDVMEQFGGYESYQKADKVFTMNQINAALQDGNVALEEGKGYYTTTEAGERNYLQQTYNHKSEPVWALLRSGSLDTGLDQNVHEFVDEETGKRHVYDAVTLADLEHDRVRLNSENEKSLFVLTDIGRQKMNAAQKTAVKVKQHNEVINEMLRVVREARDENREEQIILTEELKQTFNINKNELTSRQMFIHASKYFADAQAAGLTDVTFEDAGIRDGHAFNNLRGHLYQARAERHPVWDELKRWGDVGKELRSERNGLMREFNVLKDNRDGMASDFATSEEIQQEYDKRLHLDELHAETTKYNKITDDMDSALERIQEGYEETDNSGTRAKREILDAVIKSRADMNPDEQAKRQAIQAVLDQAELGRPITKSVFHSMRMGTLKEDIELRKTAGEAVDAPAASVSDVPEDMQNAPREGTPVTRTAASLAREESNRLYDMILEDINRDQNAMGLPQLRAFDVRSLQGVLNTPKEVQDWKDAQERMVANDALYRRKGDYSLYNIKKVLEDGTVIGEKLAVPASAFNLELKVADSWGGMSREQVRETLDKTTDALLPDAEKLDDYRLTDEQQAKLDKARNTFIETIKGDKTYTKALSRASVGELMTSHESLERFQSNSKFSVVANKRLMDITASRAGWMIREGMEHELASNIAMAVHEALQERQSIKIGKKNGVYMFDEGFEDSFTKFLHRTHFEMAAIDGPKKDAAHSLIREVADFAKEYVKQDDTLTPMENEKRLVSEVHRLLSAEATEEVLKYDHYKKALNPALISDVIRGEADTISSVTSLEQLNYIKDDKIHAGESFDELQEQESLRLSETEMIERSIDENRKTVADVKEKAADIDFDNTGYISEGKVKHHYHEMEFIRRNVDSLLTDGQAESERAENKLRNLIGSDYVNDLMTGKGDASDWGLFRQYFDNKLLPEYGGDGAYQLVQSLNGYKVDGQAVLNEGFWQGIHKEILTPNITTPERVKSYIELIDTMPSLEAKWSLNTDELRRLMPEQSVGGLLNGRHELSDMLPDDDTFHLFVGKQGDLMARSNMTNLIFNVTGQDGKGGVERIVDAWSALVEKPSREGFVAKLPTMDGTHVASPGDALPIAINNAYNANRINRSPSGVGFMSSSDVSTRSGFERILSGQEAVGFDFETTGFMKSDFLKERGLILPTEAFFRTGQMLDGQFQAGESKHVFLDVGAQQDVNGTTVRDIVAKELGSMKSSDIVREVLGPDAKRWDMLSNEDQLKVMKSDKVAFLRNIAKYSGSLNESDMANITNFNYRPTSFKNEYEGLIRHAKSGLDNLAAGTVKAGATYTKTLEDFMNVYNEQTAGKVLIAQNGADADLPWARHFAEKAGVAIDQKPQMVEMIHLSRLLNPEERSHSLAAQIGRSQIPGLLEAYNSGSHLADVDTDAMMRLFGEKYVPEAQAANLHQMDWLKPGQYMVRLGSTGSNKIPHDVYRVGDITKQDLRDADTGSYRLPLNNMDGDAVTSIETPSLQELQRNISKNYKVFDSEDDAKKFLTDLTFDDAREDISGAMFDYDNMIRERNRLAGPDAGMQNLRARYDALQEGIKKGAINPEELSVLDQKVIQNGSTVSDAKMAKYGTPEYSERQKRAMAETAGFFKSEDAALRQEFLGEVENLRIAGAVDRSGASDMIRQYNERIKQRAREVGRTIPEREVPGLVNLGRVEGEQFTGLQGRQFTVLANTYEQAERGLWEVANNFKPLTSQGAQQAGTWRGEAVDMLTKHLKQTGIMAPDAGGRMEDAVDAVLTHLQTNGNMKVEDMTQPLITGDNADEMRQIFLDTRNELLAEPMHLMETRPDMKATYDATKQLRGEIESQNLATYGFNYKVAGDYEGQYLRTEGDFAFRHADDLMEEIHALSAMDNQETVTPRINDLWREVYNRASHAGTWDETAGELRHYSDRDAARSYLGWDATPNQYVHPSETKNYAAGTKYYDMEEKDIRGIAEYSPRPEIRDRARDYLNKAFGENGTEKTFSHINPSQRMNMESIVDVITAEPEAPTLGLDNYVDEVEWDRPLNSNRPLSEVDHAFSTVREKATDIRHEMAQYMPSKKVMGIIAAGAGAAYLVSQWTRGDSITPESRPQSDQAPDVNGNYQRGQVAPPPPQPQMQNKAYVQPNDGVNINIQAKNRSGVTQGQIDSAIQKAMGGQSASVTVHHQDDTTSISGQWLQDKFAQLLDNGFVN